jgi:hypothetical protein
VQREIKASKVLLERLEHRACPELWVVQELLVHLELPAHLARLVDLELQVALVLLVFPAQLEHLVFQARPEPLEHLVSIFTQIIFCICILKYFAYVCICSCDVK